MTSIEISDNNIAQMFKALGDTTRLRIFQFLCCCNTPVALEDSGEVRPLVGMTVGEVCCKVTGTDKMSSTISHHLKELRLAGLIEMERRGRHIICCINQSALHSLKVYFAQLDANCCAHLHIEGENNDEHTAS